MAKKNYGSVKTTINANGTITFSNAIVTTQANGPVSLSNSNTANYVTKWLGGGGALTQLQAIPVKSPHSWPKRHSHRCGVYHYNITKIYQRLVGIESDITLHRQDPTVFLKYWSDHEIEVFTRIKKDLADLYNNRFVEYTKMIAQEKGFDIPNLESTTKFKLK